MPCLLLFLTSFLIFIYFIWKADRHRERYIQREAFHLLADSQISAVARTGSGLSQELRTQARPWVQVAELRRLSYHQPPPTIQEPLKLSAFLWDERDPSSTLIAAPTAPSFFQLKLQNEDRFCWCIFKAAKPTQWYFIIKSILILFLKASVYHPAAKWGIWGIRHLHCLEKKKPQQMHEIWPFNRNWTSANSLLGLYLPSCLCLLLNSCYPFISRLTGHEL